jgi:hypothetical protein
MLHTRSCNVGGTPPSTVTRNPIETVTERFERLYGLIARKRKDDVRVRILIYPCHNPTQSRSGTRSVQTWLPMHLTCDEKRHIKRHMRKTTSSWTGVIVSTLERPSRRERLDMINNIVHEFYTPVVKCYRQ